MKVNFCAAKVCNRTTKINKKTFKKTEKERAIDNIGYSLAAGTIAGIITAGVMFKNNRPKLILNAIEIGAVTSGATYLACLLMDKFYKNNK